MGTAGSAGPSETAVTSPSGAAFTLTIDSAPPGAIVTEGESVVGVTPVKVAIDRAAVASSPRTFVVMKDGFTPSRLVQGPSDDNVRSVVSLAPSPLAPEGSSAVKSRPPSGGKPALQAAGTPPAKPTATAAATANGPGMDIRLKR
jgi:hypothetical protein